jgi:PAS domain S-box-containing protein
MHMANPADSANILLTGSEEQFRLLVKSVIDYAIYMLDPQGNVSSWNAGAERIKGYREEEVLGHSFTQFYTAEDQAAGIPARNLEQAAHAGRVETEGWRVRKNGELFWAHVIIDRVVGDDGHLVGFAKVTRDDTAKREAAEQLERTRQALIQAQKMEAIGRLTGGVAHDFNNLLMAILSNLEVLSERVPADDTRAHMLLNNAIAGAHRGSALTQRMLAFARRQELKPKPVVVPHLVHDMATLLHRAVGSKVTIETSFSLDLDRAMVDANQLELALMNLIVNARDAMPEGGVIQVRGRMEAMASENEAGIAAGRYVCLEVCDTGTGMDEATLTQATEPFFTTKGVGKGTGLGLSMVHGLAAQSHGRLLLKSRPGEGTTAQLWLPVAPDTAAEVSAIPAKTLASSTNLLRILVVDDDTLILATLVILLEAMGHEALEAASAKEALDVLNKNSVDLVITDYAMPGMSGKELVEYMSDRWPDIPVILASGYTDMGAEDLPVDRLTKPYGRVELVAAINKRLARARSESVGT